MVGLSVILLGEMDSR